MHPGDTLGEPKQVPSLPQGTRYFSQSTLPHAGSSGPAFYGVPPLIAQATGGPALSAPALPLLFQQRVDSISLA